MNFNEYKFLLYINDFSGSGIGKNLALKLAKMGNIIVCVDINEEANSQTGIFI